MTRLFAVIGSPISHSLSPAMHTAAFRALRLDACYTAIDVPPRHVRPMLKALTLAGVEGFNVTVPLKEAVMPLLDRLDPTAQAMGAVNTIVVRGRRLIGYNTDGIGFGRALRELGWRGHPVHAVILGAGGASHAVTWELSRVPGSRLTITDLYPERARRLARWLIRHHRRVDAQAVRLDQLTLEGADLVVNATTVGMRVEDGCPVDPGLLRRGMLVYDLVYHRQTPLVQAARRRGCVAANGLSMLLYQGAESLRLWLGRTPPVESMRRALLRAIRNR